MVYKSQFIRFGHTRYEKNIAKLRWRDLKRREEAYKDAVRTIDEVDSMHDASLNYIDSVMHYAIRCEQSLKRGLISDDDDAMLVLRYGVETLGQDEYDWMKDELAKKGEEVDDRWSI